MDFSNQFKNIENLNKQLENIVKLQNDAYSKLDEETYAKVKQHQIDANKMLREFQKRLLQRTHRSKVQFLKWSLSKKL